VTEVLRVRVAEVVQETADARSLVLDADFNYRPGQFLTVKCGPVARCYSLSSSPDTDDRPQVTVKRMGFGSGWVCDNVRPGTFLEILPPAGVFTPKSFDGDFLLFAAGSGITPVISIIKSVLARGTGKLVLVYANRDADSVIFAGQLRALADSHPGRLLVVHWLETLQGLPTARHFDPLRPFTEYQTFVCGPGAFMDVVRDSLKSLGVPRKSVHIERFVSLAGNPFERTATPEQSGGEATVEVDLDGTTREFAWPRHQKLLDLLLEKGLAAPYSCREGACSACACRVTDGEVKMLNNEVLDQEDLADGITLACQSLPVTDTVKITYG
jgi:3-ketosteroid 9alpha-monooxygenase subunit B